MFMKDDKKKGGIAALIIAKKKDPSQPESELKDAPSNENGQQTDYEMGIDAAVEDVMSSLESKDKAGFKTSLKSLITMIMDEDSDMSRGEEDS